MITKHLNNYKDLDFVSGDVILIDKDSGFTSFDIVYKIRKSIGVKKVGHAGTLDPSATGLLIVCTGKKTKEIYKYQDQIKKYEGVITIGKTTPSYDGETEFNSEHNFDNVTSEMIMKAKEKFVGEISQVPPMYSALKVKGKSLYKLARKGIEIERQPRNISVSKFFISEMKLPDISFQIECSKGTYIRSIANDLGAELGCGAYLKELRRTGIGDYSVEDAVKINEFMKINSSISIAT